MNIGRPKKQASHPLLQRLFLGFGIAATVLAVATVVFVYRTMTDFHTELMQRAEATHDQLLLDMIARDARTMTLILAAIVLVAALNIAAGFAMIMRRQPQ